MAVLSGPIAPLRSGNPELNRIQDKILAPVNAFLNSNIVWVVIGQAGAPGFANGWSQYQPNSTTYAPPGFSKDSFGIVRLRGALTGGTINKAGFILPVGYRPAFRSLFFSVGSSAGGDIVVRTDVMQSNGATNAGGVILSESLVPANAATNTFWFLDGISFLAEN